MVSAIYMGNSIEYIIAYFAILLAGKKAFLLNPLYPITEVINLVRLVECDTVVTDVKDKSLMNLYKVIAPKYSKDVCVNIPSIDDKKEEGAIIVPSSGTTGNAKLIMLTHGNLMTNVKDIVTSYSELQSKDAELIILPLTSIFCNTTQMLVPFFSCMTVYLWTGGFNMPGIIKEMEMRKITYCQMVPAILRLFAKFYVKSKVKLPYFKRITIGGEPISVDELKSISEAIAPIRVLQGYGMTEASPVIAAQTRKSNGDKYGSSGNVMESVQIRIVAEKGRREGIIWVKGPSICKRTYNGNSLVNEEDWLDTGDVGYMDEEGELYVCGREKNIIVVGGMNIYPEEVEGVIRAYPSVSDVLVYGVKDLMGGENINADIVIREKMDVSELKKFCARYLPIYKVPTKIQIVSKLDKTYTSKVKRKR